MRAFGIFVLICIAAVSMTVSADGQCERIEDDDWSIGTNIKTCVMLTTVIDSKDFQITSDRDESVEWFNSIENKKLKYLPNNLGAKFPSLLGLSGSFGSIRELSRDNFKGLSKLRRLYLQYNRIEKIDDVTFEYNPAVEEIYLNNNKIKKLNGRAFASLHKLTTVYLSSNDCINEDFDEATRIAELPQVVTGKCGFTEPETSSGGDGLMAQSEELQALKLENARLRIEKAEADLQIAHHNELEAQLKETCDARFELKVQENVNLSNDLKVKIAEINDKSEKIRQCEEKSQITGGS